MGRKANPLTPYYVRSEVSNGYRYAYVQKKVRVGEHPDQTEKRRKVFLGTLSEDDVFTPNKTFRLMNIEERQKLIFPETWDISLAKALDVGEKGAPEEKQTDVNDKEQEEDTIMPEGETHLLDAPDTPRQKEQIFVAVQTANVVSSCKIYGSVWLMEQLAEKKGLIADLLEVFHGDIGAVNDVLTLAIYTIVDYRSFNRLDRWLDTHKALADHKFGSDYVTRFMQTITDEHRMKLIGLRLARQPKESEDSIDSSSRSAYGKCLVNLKYGKNQDGDDFPCSLEVYVYSLPTHEPIYYRRMPGNRSDMVTMRIILDDMKKLGICDDGLTFMTDRRYRKETMGLFHRMGVPFLISAKVNEAPVIDCLMKLEYDKVGLPIHMEYDEEEKLYYAQYAANDFAVTLEDGTVHKVRGVKVNMFMNPGKRLSDAARVSLDIQEEKKQVAEYELGKKPIPPLNEVNASFKYHQGQFNKETGTVEILYKQDAVDKAYAQCGFFSSCMYKCDMNGIEAYREYKTRDEHEKNFFCLRQDELAEREECSLEKGAEGIGFIYFVGLIMLHTLEHTWKTKLKSKLKTSYEVLDAMETIRFSEYISGNAHMTAFNGEQMDICNAFEIVPPLDCMPATVKEKMRRKT